MRPGPRSFAAFVLCTAAFVGFGGAASAAHTASGTGAAGTYTLYDRFADGDGTYSTVALRLRRKGVGKDDAGEPYTWRTWGKADENIVMHLTNAGKIVIFRAKLTGLATPTGFNSAANPGVLTVLKGGTVNGDWYAIKTS